MTVMDERQRGPLRHPGATPGGHGRRDDIQGLRALAVMVVVAYHAGLPGVPGGFAGVDLFFVLSGFLITQLLLREISATGTVRLREFWARRARRILPISVLVLVATLFASRAVLSPLERPAIGKDVLWSALFSGNWRFAQQQTDYLAAERDPSPVLHYWSLGVEEQFYVVWPLLLIGLAVVCRSRGWRPAVRTVAFGGAISAVIIVSLAYCIQTTATDQPYAFFGTPARAWQLAAGALTALAVPAILRLRAGTRGALGLAGLLLLGLCVAALDESGTAGVLYPSWLAVAPTVAGVLLVAAGTGPSSRLGRALSIRPLTWIGDLSFSVYLWHWPVLVIGMEALGSRSPQARLALVALALGLSIASHRLVEDPVRHARGLARRPLVSLAVGAALVSAVVPLAAHASRSGTIDRVVVAPDGPARSEDVAPVSRQVRPSLDAAADDTGPFKDRGCQLDFDAVTPPSWDGCTFADRSGDRTVLVLGDSIAGAIAPAVVAAGERRGWAVTVWAKNRCPIADVTRFDPDLGGVYEECTAFREAALAEAERRRPDVAVLAISRMSTDSLSVDGRTIGGRHAVGPATDGLERTIRRLRAAGIHVVLSDSPHRAPFSPTSCLAEERDVRRCVFPTNRKPSIMAAASRDLGDDVTLVKANQTVCPDGTCQPVVDDVVVYRDRLHFTQTFARTLAGLFAVGIDRAASGPG